jgi:nucleotide-binding universal stress UspA family protein
MEKILVPVDFSDHTSISCNYAIELSKVTHAEIILFHSFFEQIYFSDGGFATGFESGIMLTDEIILDFYKQKEKQLNDLANKIRNNTRNTEGSPINVTAMIETGDPQIQILNIITKISPDLVIMGSSGLGKKGFLSGSVSKRVIDHSQTPSMAIPENTRAKQPRNILYVTDIEQNDVGALKKLAHLFTDFKCEFHCLHLNVNDKDSDSENQMLELSKKDFFQDSIEGYTFKILSCHHPRRSLIEYITENEIDLIAFIPHRKNFFSIFTRQDLSKEDLFETGLPILAVI